MELLHIKTLQKIFPSLFLHFPTWLHHFSSICDSDQICLVSDLWSCWLSSIGMFLYFFWCFVPINFRYNFTKKKRQIIPARTGAKTAFLWCKLHGNTEDQSCPTHYTISRCKKSRPIVFLRTSYLIVPWSHFPHPAIIPFTIHPRPSLSQRVEVPFRSKSLNRIISMAHRLVGPA